MQTDPSAIAVLVSGGFDSAILVGDLARAGRAVQPIYVRAGLRWEATELEHLQRFLFEFAAANVRPLVVLELPCADLYGDHWSLTGQGVPDADSPDQAVFLPGRNLLLLLKGILWCHLHGIRELALGILRGNPFPDARPEFFKDFQRVANNGIGSDVQVQLPYGQLDKGAVLERGRGMPLQWTFSCIRPLEGRHCGACNKCAERRKAFAMLGVTDPTNYANP
jgi:7-cyano-7-deazaguanine synthase